MTDKHNSIFDAEMTTLLGEPLDPFLFNLEQYSVQEINDLIEQPRRTSALAYSQ